MHVYIAIILQVMLWHVDNAPALKYNGYKLKSWPAGHLEKGSVQCEGVHIWDAAFLINH